MNADPSLTRLLSGREGVEQAIVLLRKGECVALPTETVYGLAADAQNPAAVLKIFEAKGRPSNHPLIVHIPAMSHLPRWVDLVPACVHKLAAAFWPGPLTMIFKAKAGLNNPVTGGLPTVALRIPAHPLFLQILTELDTGLAAPSANRYKSLSPTRAEQAMQQLNGRIKAVLDGGNCDHGIESTILDVSGDTLRVLRAGPISAAEIAAVVGQEVAVPAVHQEVVPGNVAAHYQPNTPVSLLPEHSLISRIEQADSHTHFLVYSAAAIAALKRLDIPSDRQVVLPATAAEFAKNMYYSLFQLDQPGTQEICIEMPPDEPSWLAVNDRLSRAASK
jgi:L-threonylcarbamoyladenylate synthase